MVTHGYIIFKYKGIYYTFNHHADSYFEHLGNLVVNEIDKMINKNQVQYYKELLLRIPLKGNNEGDSSFGSFYYLLNNPEYNEYFTSNTKPCNEYTYTIDFDSNKFIATRYGENIYSFYLYDIPLDWYEITQNHSSYNDNHNDNHNNSDSDSDSDSDLDDNDTILNKIKELEDKIERLKLKLS